MDPFLGWVESTAVSVWLRESPSLWVFPFALILHTVGLAFLVGVNILISLRVLGLAPAVPFRSLERYYTVMWTGFWVNAASGVALLAAYPTKALTNPLFYVKLGLIAAALVVGRRIRAHMQGLAPTDLPAFPAPVRVLAVVSLGCWAASIAAGRFLAYTYTRLLVDFYA